MKKVVLFCASALLAGIAQVRATETQSAQSSEIRLAASLETVREGLVPDYGNDGYLYAVFVTLQREQSSMKIVSVDPNPVAMKQQGGQWVDVTSEVLISSKVWIDSEGWLCYELTYQYPGWPVRTYSSRFSYI